MTLNSNYCETAVWGVGLAAGWSRFLKNRQFLKKSVGDELNLEPVNYNFELFTSGCRWMRWNKGKDNNSRNELKTRLGISYRRTAHSHHLLILPVTAQSRCDLESCRNEEKEYFCRSVL